MTFKDVCTRLKDALLARLTEASTWRAIIFFVAMAVGHGLTTYPEELITSVSVSLAYTIGVLFPDALKRRKEEGEPQGKPDNES